MSTDIIAQGLATSPTTLIKSRIAGLQKSASVVMLGDSITQQSIVQNGPQQPNAQYGVIGAWLSNGKYHLRKISGVFGNTSQQIAARFWEEVAPYKPDMCFILEGTNDVSQTVATAVTLANEAANIANCYAIGALPVIVAAPPRGLSSAPTATYATNTKALNALRQSQALALGAIWVDVWTPLADPTNLWWADPNDSSDGVHPTEAGARKMAAALNAALAPWMPVHVPQVAGIRGSQYGGVYDIGNPIPNPTMLNTVGGGTTADGWTVAGVATGKTTSLTADPKGTGNLQNVSFNSSAASGSYSFTSTAFSIAQFRGKRVAFSFYVSTSGFQASGATFTARLTWTNYSGTIVTPMQAFTHDGSGIMYVETIIPADVTTATVLILITSPASGSVACSLSFGEFALIDLREPKVLLGSRTERPLQAVATVTANYTMTIDDEIVYVDATSGNVTVTLPPAGANSYVINGYAAGYGPTFYPVGVRPYVIQRIDGSGNTVTIAGNGTDTINGAGTTTLASQYAVARIRPGGTGKNYIE